MKRVVLSLLFFLSIPSRASTVADPRNEAIIINEYYDPSTQEARNHCIAQVYGEAIAQAAEYLATLGIQINQKGATEWLGTSGTVTDSTHGTETLRYKTPYHARKERKSAPLLALTRIHVDVYTKTNRTVMDRKVDELGNIIKPGKGVDILKKSVKTTITLQMVNPASGVLLIRSLNEALHSDEQGDTAGARRKLARRVEKLRCAVLFRPVEVEVPQSK